MAYISHSIGSFFVVRWLKTEPGDLEKILRDVALVRAASKHPLTYVSLSDDKTPPPDEERRKELIQRLESFLKHCESFYVILESRGFRGSVLRAVIGGMMLIHPSSRNVMVRGSIREAFAENRHRLPMPEAELIQVLKSKDVLPPDWAG